MSVVWSQTQGEGSEGEKVSESKCSVMPSGSVSFHVWETGDKSGDRCKCGERVLDGLSDDSAKLLEIQEVLKWASEHVCALRPIQFNELQPQSWAVAWDRNNVTNQPTLYEALYFAWNGRNKEST